LFIAVWAITIQTKHPKLFILNTQPEHTFKSQTRISINNLDISLYVNSKFIYVERHLITQLYRNIMNQKCEMEKQILKNILSLSSIALDEMAFRLMKTPEYTAIIAGKVIYIITCVPVKCEIRQTEKCYNELPVIYNNPLYYLFPRIRILIKEGHILN